MSRGAHRQAEFGCRFDWGLGGALAMVEDARPGDVAVVVDVLSFTTTLSVALERGVVVHPYPWPYPSPYPSQSGDPQAYAAERGATLAAGRREGRADGSVSLSPMSFAGLDGIDRVVLPSPNGSAIAFALAGAGTLVVGACLRNASAVARWLGSRRAARVSVVGAGERRPDGELRPAVEDLWGAGAVLAGLGERGRSPEAAAAVAAFELVRHRLADELPRCASGRELVEDGFAGDVALAAAYDASRVVPLLTGDAFRDAQAV